jgi:hypothetical protein
MLLLPGLLEALDVLGLALDCRIGRPYSDRFEAWLGGVSAIRKVDGHE